MSTLAKEIRRLSGEAWLEFQYRPLCEDERYDLECAMSDLDAVYRADSDAQGQEKAA